MTKFDLWNDLSVKNLELCLRLFPKLNTFKFYYEFCFDESDEESGEKSVPLELLADRMQKIPFIQLEDGIIHSGEETEKILDKILEMHPTRVH